MTYSIIPKSHLEGALRLDPEYYQPEYLDLIKKLGKLTDKKLKDHALNITRRFKPIKGEFFNYIEISEIDLGNGTFNESKILGEDAPDRAQKVVKDGDVIVSTVRPNRNAVSLIRSEHDNFVASSGFCVIEPQKVSAEYLFAYLKTGHAIKLLDRLTAASMYPAVTEEDIMNLPFYVKNEQTIKKIVKEVFEQIEKSKSLYAQAEDLLLEELGIKDLEQEEDLTFWATLKDCLEAGRIDPDFFQPKYERILSKIKVKKEKLVNLVKRKNSIIKILKDKHYNYIEISDVNVGTGEASFNTIESQDLPANAKMKLEGGELIISKVRPTRGAIAIIPEQWGNNFIASGAFTVFKADSPLKEYIFLVLRTQIGKLQFEKPTTGTSYPTITDEDVENVIIPILPLKTQQKIAELVNESFKLRKEAKELLEEAKKRVEEEIEGK